MTDYFSGQRWLCDTQPELGLGLVTWADPRCVRIAFPATGETRFYALKGRP